MSVFVILATAAPPFGAGRGRRDQTVYSKSAMSRHSGRRVAGALRFDQSVSRRPASSASPGALFLTELAGSKLGGVCLLIAGDNSGTPASRRQESYR